MNQGVAEANDLLESGRADAAIALLKDRFASITEADEAGARGLLAKALLLTGRFEEGWEELERSSGGADFRIPCHATPPWEGMVDPAGTLLVEVGGDASRSIQCLRYIPFIAREGMRVVVRCPADLEDLVQTVEGVASTCRIEEPEPRHTAWVQLLSLPRLFKTRIDRIPRNVPYIHPPFAGVKSWRGRLDALGDTIKVGLRWTTDSPTPNGQDISVPLDRFLGLAGMERVTFVGLEGGVKQEDRDAARQIGLHDFSPELADPIVVAALIANLDLVVSVQSTVLHLAGALGRPAWGLLSSVPDWCWLLDRADSPWYPTVRLYRRRVGGQWQEVVDRMVITLAEAARLAREGEQP